LKLSSIEIRNYRSIFCETGEPSLNLELGDGVNAIAGPNNTGKSNIFRALALALDPGGNQHFAYEAEDLRADRLFTRFVKGKEDERLNGKSRRPKPEGGWHFDLVPAAKGAFVGFLESEAGPADSKRWVQLYERIRATGT
jgi:hypothetical protein